MMKREKEKKKDDMPPYPLVFVRWLDSYGCSSEWSEISNADEPVSHECLSVGWLVQETSEVIVLVPHYSPAHKRIGAEEQGCGDMTIPKVAIKSRRILCE